MAIDLATVCNEVECNCRHGFNNETFKNYVLQLLCGLSASSFESAASSVEAAATNLAAAASGINSIFDPTPLAPITLAFGVISTTYPGTPQIDISPAYYRSVTVANSTNQPVLMSVDGSITYLTVPAGEAKTLAVLRPSQLFFKSVVAPTSGSVGVTGY